MDRTDYYKYYQENIELLDCEIEQVKISAQRAIGEKAWQEKNGRASTQIAVTEKKVKANTRLYTFLICSWFEARLLKMLYENSLVAFSDSEIQAIRNMKSMSQKWKTSFLLAVCKSYGFPYVPNKDYTSDFTNGSIEQKHYIKICSLFNDVEDAITIRNRLAHGQWDVQFNSENTRVVNYDFLNRYDNIQKLHSLKQCFNEIADIISAYVTYKDKRNANFSHIVEEKLKNIIQIKKRIENSDYQKYINQLERVYTKTVTKQAK